MLFILETFTFYQPIGANKTVTETASAQSQGALANRVGTEMLVINGIAPTLSATWISIHSRFNTAPTAVRMACAIQTPSSANAKSQMAPLIISTGRTAH